MKKKFEKLMDGFIGQDLEFWYVYFGMLVLMGLAIGLVIWMIDHPGQVMNLGSQIRIIEYK